LCAYRIRRPSNGLASFFSHAPKHMRVNVADT
jgi:hypothetical protein